MRTREDPVRPPESAIDGVQVFPSLPPSRPGNEKLAACRDELKASPPPLIMAASLSGRPEARIVPSWVHLCRQNNPTPDLYVQYVDHELAYNAASTARH
jgi:hypothetical protein